MARKGSPENKKTRRSGAMAEPSTSKHVGLIQRIIFLIAKVKSFLRCSKIKKEDGGGFGAGKVGEGEECVKFNYTTSSTLMNNCGGF